MNKINEPGYKFRMSSLDSRSRKNSNAGKTNVQNGNGHKNDRRCFAYT